MIELLQPVSEEIVEMTETAEPSQEVPETAILNSEMFKRAKEAFRQPHDWWLMFYDCRLVKIIQDEVIEPDRLELEAQE